MGGDDGSSSPDPFVGVDTAAVLSDAMDTAATEASAAAAEASAAPVQAIELPTPTPHLLGLLGAAQSTPARVGAAEAAIAGIMAGVRGGPTTTSTTAVPSVAELRVDAVATANGIVYAARCVRVCVCVCVVSLRLCVCASARV